MWPADISPSATKTDRLDRLQRRNLQSSSNCASSQLRAATLPDQSDTWKTIIHLYEEYGRAVSAPAGDVCFRDLGPRRRRETLFLARDRLGIKPLYYRLTPESFALRFRNKSHSGERRNSLGIQLFRMPGVPGFGYLSGPETFYQGIRKLMPGNTWRSAEVDSPR